MDLFVANDTMPNFLFINKGGGKFEEVGLQLVATKSNSGAIGAIITWIAGGVKHSRLKTSGGSYLASHDPREVIGIGAQTRIDSVEIRWPSGKADKLTNLPLKTYIKVVEGMSSTK